jgi:hypothetical protein
MILKIFSPKIQHNNWRFILIILLVYEKVILKVVCKNNANFLSWILVKSPKIAPNSRKMPENCKNRRK